MVFVWLDIQISFPSTLYITTFPFLLNEVLKILKITLSHTFIFPPWKSYLSGYFKYLVNGFGKMLYPGDLVLILIPVLNLVCLGEAC